MAKRRQHTRAVADIESPQRRQVQVVEVVAGALTVS